MGLYNPEFFRERIASKNKNLNILLEAIIRQFFIDILNKGDYAIDCGSADGLHTISMAKYVGSTGLVHAIDAKPNLSKLKRFIFIIGLKNIIIHNHAISDYEGMSTFNYVVSSPGYSGLNRQNYPSFIQDKEITKIKVKVSTLDNIIAHKNKIKFIKMDLEGGEYGALLGAKEIIAASRPPIILEMGFKSAAEHNGYTEKDFLDFFLERDYILIDLLGNTIDSSYWCGRNLIYYGLAYPKENPHYKKVIEKAVIKMMNYMEIQL